MIANERGIALVITLLVVSLLTITVVEFTYSVSVDQHMAHNALQGLQASLLARSGINLGEALLLHDTNSSPPRFAYADDWCPEPTEHSCRIDASNVGVLIPNNMLLRVEIVDEGGKLNINLMRPANCNGLDNQDGPFQLRLKVLERLLEGRGFGPELRDSFENYWRQRCDASACNPSGPGTPGGGGQPQATPTPGAPNQSGNLVRQCNEWLAASEFTSLDDAGIVPGFDPIVIRRLRPILTAFQSRSGGPGQGGVNLNTAPRQVLMAIYGDDGVVEEIITQRRDKPLEAASLGQFRNELPPERRSGADMVGVSSALFLVRASAIINSNPVTGRGGLSRSASMLVRRTLRPGVPLNAPAGTPRWTLTQLDWQKEGGAALFQQRTDQESGADEPGALDAFGTNG